MPIPTGKPEQHQRVLLRDMVRERIRDAIMDGTLRPGEDLRDEDLQSWLGVSRTPIRDAVNELTRMGLIEMAPNRYTRVATPSEGEALSAYNTLGVILGGVVRLAVPLLPPAERKRISGELDKFLVTARDGDYEAMRVRFLPVFDRFIEHCENPQLSAVCRDTLDGLAYKIRVERMRTLIDLPRLIESFEALQKATQDGAAITAELATEEIFLLPGERPS